MNSSGRLPSADWTTLGAARAEPGAELLRRRADEPGERGQRDRSDDERHDIAGAAKWQTPATTTTAEGDRELDPFAPVHRRETANRP